MPNMSYCRFQNTLGDLQDCYDNWYELDEDDSTNSKYEMRSREKMLKLCRDIVDEFEEEIIDNKNSILKAISILEPISMTFNDDVQRAIDILKQNVRIIIR